MWNHHVSLVHVRCVFVAHFNVFSFKLEYICTSPILNGFSVQQWFSLFVFSLEQDKWAALMKRITV